MWKRNITILVFLLQAASSFAAELFSSQNEYIILSDKGQFIIIYFNPDDTYDKMTVNIYSQNGNIYTIITNDGNTIELERSGNELIHKISGKRYVKMTFEEGRRAKNIISILTSVVFFSVSYELKINDMFSIILESGYGNSFLYFHPNYIVDGKLRWYPWQNMFFVELGLGYGQKYIDKNGNSNSFLEPEGEWYRRDGFMISPGLGWKFDLGQTDSFIMAINLGASWITGPETFSNLDLDITPYAKIGIGWAF
jgi:hypothetical protein